MTDLGFGLADKRSVMVILFVFVLSHFLLKFPIPIDLSNALTVFLSLIFLTGFLFITRAVARLVLILIFSLIKLPFDLLFEFKQAFPHTQEKLTSLELRKKIQSMAHITFRDFLRDDILMPILEPDWHFVLSNATTYDKGYYLYRVILGFFDRFCLIGIAFVATFPKISFLLQSVGILGIMLMLIVYLVTGRFTFFLLDAVHRSEIDRENLRSAASNPNISFPSYPTRHESDYGGGL